MSLFPEFIPVLASKTEDLGLAERLYQHGCTKASSDASAGLILGIALYGPTFAPLLKKIIWNPEWEAGSSATGNARFTLMGMDCVGIGLCDLYLDLPNALEEKGPQADAGIYTFTGLLQAALYRAEINPVSIIPRKRESFLTLYNTFFKWKNPNKDDSIIGLVSDYAKKMGKEEGPAIEELQGLRDSYRQRAEHEQELSCYTPIRLS